MHNVLEMAGFDVSSFADGADISLEASAMADAYINDIHLGATSGLALCKQIKASTSQKSKAVVIIISAFPEVQKLAMEACADDILAKPFSKNQLITKVKEHLLGDSGVN